MIWGILTGFYNGMLVAQGFRWMRGLWRPSENPGEIYWKRSESRQLGTPSRQAQKRRVDAITSDVEQNTQSDVSAEDMYPRAERTISWVDPTVAPIDHPEETRRASQSRYSMVRNEANMNSRRKITSPDMHSIGRPGSQVSHRADEDIVTSGETLG